MGKYNPEHEAILKTLLGQSENAQEGKMFGYPGYLVNGKLAVGLHEQGVIAKVGRERAAELLNREGFSAFEPQPGRVWKDWILLTDGPENYTEVFDEALTFVTKETSK